ncbi:membrane-bound lytic murein transglycosylase B [Sinobacterium caligoides]|uniref:Membrane-bound lytic murein transglycosylase B n=1 Tax=Sinobacterium caligoides TaxID=933926 RepID=A0A3N2DNI5_9GAMM|nr:lytic murein transglycosylase B [Sinobacterium caligoides]ROS01368.1 membrane-bound lytic murein transglycosylase B [Sinobacterium caligoides]
MSVKNWLVAGALLLPSLSVQADYTSNPQVAGFVDEMVAEHGFERAELTELFSEAEKQQSIIDAISRPAERVKPWKDYRKIFLGGDRAERGAAFYKKYKAELDRAEQVYGVPAEIIIAIIGVETRYGSFTGRYRVLDSLSTLAFDYPPRAKFFRSELVHYLILTREQGVDPRSLKGSYAGAMGWGQFISSSYRHYAVDFDHDGHIDIWNNPSDAIGSVANYFKEHGWKAGEPVVERVAVAKGADASKVNTGLKLRFTVGELTASGYTAHARLAKDMPANIWKLDGADGDEYWMALPNFFAITRYNHSQLYAMAVYQLSQEIAVLIKP